MKYIKDIDETKDQLAKEIHKYSSLSPSDSILEDITNLKSQIESLNQEHENKIHEINNKNEIMIKQLSDKYNKDLIDASDSSNSKIQDLVKKHEETICKLRLQHEEEIKTIESNLKQQLSQANLEKANTLNELKITKDSLNESLFKIEELNKSIGRFESKESMSEATYTSKDKDISELKMQNNELILSLKTIQEQTQKEYERKLELLEEKINNYKFELADQDQKHNIEIWQLESMHSEEIEKLDKHLNQTLETHLNKIENLNDIIKEKEEIIKTSVDNYKSQIDVRDMNLNNLNNTIKDIRSSYSLLEEQLKKAQGKSQLVIERFKEEMHSVLSLKSALTDEDTIASKEEFNENMKIINDFWENPFSKSLKKIFKLKRVRQEDKSVDSSNLLEKNHQEESGYHETETHEISYETVERIDINKGRIEEMAQPGFRPQAQRSRGRGVPAPQRGRGAPPATTRGRTGDPRMPPRHKARVGTQATQSTISNNSVPNIQIMDPNSKYLLSY